MCVRGGEGGKSGPRSSPAGCPREASSRCREAASCAGPPTQPRTSGNSPEGQAHSVHRGGTPPTLHPTPWAPSTGEPVGQQMGPHKGRRPAGNIVPGQCSNTVIVQKTGAPPRGASSFPYAIPRPPHFPMNQTPKLPKHTRPPGLPGGHWQLNPPGNTQKQDNYPNSGPPTSVTA